MPIAHGLVVRALAGRAIAIDIEGDRATLTMASGRHSLTRGTDSGCAVELALTEAVIGRLLDARCTVLDAVLGGEVVLRGAAEDSRRPARRPPRLRPRRDSQSYGAALARVVPGLRGPFEGAGARSGCQPRRTT